MLGRGSKMNYLASIQQMFHCSSMDIAERMKYVNIRFSVYPSDLPSYEEFCAFISSFPSRDTLTFSMKDDAGSSLRVVSNTACTQDPYVDFRSCLYEEDPVYVTIEINKQVAQNQMSIYCYQKFCADLLSLSPSEVLLAFTGLYSEVTHLYFEVFDEGNSVVVCLVNFGFGHSLFFVEVIGDLHFVDSGIDSIVAFNPKF